MPNTCYDNIIGLAKQDCPCIKTAPPVGFNTSKSGLYIADIEPFSSYGGYSDCQAGNIWERMEAARAAAAQTFIADSNAALLTTHQTRRERFRGQIGQATGRSTKSNAYQYTGAMLACNPMRGGEVKITAIGTLFSAVGTVQVTIYNSLNDEVWSGELVTANGFYLNTLSEPIVLPSYIPFAENHEYFVVYEHNQANPARLNAVDCGCGLKSWYSLQKPMWGAGAYTGNKAWANWLMVAGWNGDSLDEFDITTNSDLSTLNGLAFQVELGCDIGAVLCDGELDFNTDPLAISIAFANLWKSRELLATAMLGSTELTRQNMVNREFLKEQRAEWQKKYEENMQYIIQQAAHNTTDCIMCRDDSGMRIGTTFA